MTTMSGIPDELMRQAMIVAITVQNGVLGEATFEETAEIIARALMHAVEQGKREERERCGQLARTHSRYGTTWQHNRPALPQVVSREISAAIYDVNN